MIREIVIAISVTFAILSAALTIYTLLSELYFYAAIFMLNTSTNTINSYVLWERD
jgi:hypothetical protein